MISDILLRSVSNPPLTTKGSTLTFSELDDNFIEIYEFLAALNNGAGIEPYNPATTYTGTYYVSYDNNIWVHVAASSTGVTPSTDPDVWELTSIGALAHQQGTDLFVGLGSAYETTAQEIYDVVNSVVITITESAFISLYNSGTLVSNKIYAVTDCALTEDAADNPILYIHSLSSTTINTVCSMTLRMPDNSGEIYPLTNWDRNISYSSGNKVVYDALVYENTTSINTTTEPKYDPTNWELKAQSTSFYVTKMYGDVQIRITNTIEVLFFTDLATRSVYTGYGDLLPKTLDTFGTVFNVQSRGFGSTVSKLSRLSLSDNENIIIEGGGGIYVNDSSFSVGNIYLYFSQIDLGSSYSSVNISNVYLKNTGIYFPLGHSVEINGLSISFPSLQQLNIAGAIPLVPPLTSPFPIIRGTIDNKGSDIAIELVIPISTTLDLDNICDGYSDIFGVFILTDNSPTIDTIVRACRLFPIKLMGKGGNAIQINKTTPSGISSNGKILNDTNVVLASNNADYIILEPVTIDVGFGTYDVWQVTEYKNNS